METEDPILNVNYEAQRYLLAGPGPHTLDASLCNQADFDAIIAVYQRADGGPGAFDPDAPCDNIVGFVDQSDGCGGNGVISVGALMPGEVEVVVMGVNFFQFGNYTLDYGSGTCGM